MACMDHLWSCVRQIQKSILLMYNLSVDTSKISQRFIISWLSIETIVKYLTSGTTRVPPIKIRLIFDMFGKGHLVHTGINPFGDKCRL